MKRFLPFLLLKLLLPFFSQAEERERNSTILSGSKRKKEREKRIRLQKKSNDLCSTCCLRGKEPRMIGTTTARLPKLFSYSPASFLFRGLLEGGSQGTREGEEREGRWYSFYGVSEAGRTMCVLVLKKKMMILVLTSSQHPSLPSLQNSK